MVFVVFCSRCHVVIHGETRGYDLGLGSQLAVQEILLLLDVTLLLETDIADHFAFLFSCWVLFDYNLALRCENICINLEVLLPEFELTFRGSLFKPNHVVKSLFFFARIE